MTKEELIDKIKKLLALADSSNPNEAAVALSRAQKLMERYNIEAVDLKIENDISESVIEPIKGLNHKHYVSVLVSIIRKAFGVEAIVRTRNSKIDAVTFIGNDSILESCKYIFVLLSRAALVAIDNYKKVVLLETMLNIVNTEDLLNYFKREEKSFYTFALKPLMKNKKVFEKAIEDINNPIVQANIKKYDSMIKDLGRQVETIGSYLNSQIRSRKKYFVEGYLTSIYSKVTEYAVTSTEQEKLDNYIESKFPNVRVTRKISRKGVTQAEYDAYLKGQEEGSNVNISTALTGHAPENKLLN